MQLLRRIFAVAVTMLAAVSPALAHPGHGHSGHSYDWRSVLHYLLEPEHAAGGVLFVLIAAAILRIGRSGNRSR